MRRGVLRICRPGLLALALIGVCVGSVSAQNRAGQVVDLTFPKRSPVSQQAARTSVPARPASAVLPAPPPISAAEKVAESYAPAPIAPPTALPVLAPVTTPPASAPMIPLPGGQLPTIPLPDSTLPNVPLPAATGDLSVPLPSQYTKVDIPLLDLPVASEAQATAESSNGMAPAVEPTADSPSAQEAIAPVESPTVPALTEPYWVSDVVRMSQTGAPNLAVLPVEYERAIWDALTHSPYVKALQLVPQINQAKVLEAQGLFDPTPFVDSIFNDSSDPVGNTLTTGGPLRLNEYRVDNGLGMRAKNQFGGSAELSQNMTLRDNNSVFLAPRQQADSKMLVKLNQPLMRGAGITYANSSIRLAQLTVGISQHEATRKLQLHAQSIAAAYWNLYAARAVELQSQRGMQRLTALRDELRKRAEVDGLESQLKRAEAAVARQTSNLARAQADVIATSANLRALVNAPEWFASETQFMPATPPVDQKLALDRTSELQSALAFHPDLMAAKDRIKSAAVRLKVAENELRPTLNLVMEGYLRGLNGDYDAGNSIADQFSQGRPSYSGGLSYQRPYRNLISKSILKQRRLEMQQLLFDLDNTMLVITADVDQAVASVNASYAELEAAVKSTLAFDEEVRYLDGRWQNAFVESTGPSLLLDELLNAQNQLIQAENAWARAQAEHMIAFAKLQLATGSLLNTASVE